VKNICVIPARGGSKRIPRKNIISFCGKPMIFYAINVAKETKLFDAIFVSTEDAEIARISSEFGAQIIDRPVELADDFTSTIDVISHAANDLENNGIEFNNICCIYPSVPLLSPKYIIEASKMNLIYRNKFIFPVVEFQSKIQRALKFNQNEELEPVYPENEHIRTQDLENAFYDAGQFYWADKTTWKDAKNIHFGGHGIKIPAFSAVDIDTIEDLELAKTIFETRRIKL